MKIKGKEKEDDEVFHFPARTGLIKDFMTHKNGDTLLPREMLFSF